MANIDEVYKFIQYLSKKTQSGNLTPDGFNTSIKRALYEWTIGKLGGTNDQGKLSFEQTKRVSDDLSFLIVRNDYTPVSPDGKLPFPSDYLYLSSARYKYKTLSDDGTTTEYVERKIDQLREGEIASASDSQIFGPRLKAGKMAFITEYAGYFKIYPSNIGQIIITYLREPITPKWAFTLVNGRPVYDPANSVDLECYEISVNEIVFIMCSYLGINLREAELIQYSEMKRQDLK